ncbi:hypothetical protein K4K57_001070 [Colletotrichum sp. SAR 10_99]|nr:hypothetical protein K4K57_001070 [Colletotrichum sp. SAR 10_99]
MSLSASRLQTRTSAPPGSRPNTPLNVPMNWASVISPKAGRSVNYSESSFRSRIERREEPEKAERRLSHDSYYSAHCEDEPQYEHLNAADIRRQVRQAPSEPRSRGHYPHQYNNRPPLPLQSERDWVEFPMKPSPSKGDRGNNYTGGKPGPICAIYNDADREVFDVAYHDKTRSLPQPKNGRN